jgi:hypothetical protein
MKQNLIPAYDFARRDFLASCGIGLGSIALQQLLSDESRGNDRAADPLAVREPHFPAKIKRVIYLFQAGGPSQLEMFTDKPKLRELSGEAPPQSMMEGKRFAFLKGTEKLLGSRRTFNQYGQCGMQLSELLPHHQEIVDQAVWLRGMVTDVFNHGPAKQFMNTGFAGAGRASLGSWATYGLGSPSKDLPGFVVLQSGPRGPRGGSTLWSAVRCGRAAFCRPAIKACRCGIRGIRSCTSVARRVTTTLGSASSSTW